MINYKLLELQDILASICEHGTIKDYFVFAHQILQFKRNREPNRLKTIITLQEDKILFEIPRVISFPKICSDGTLTDYQSLYKRIKREINCYFFHSHFHFTYNPPNTNTLFENQNCFEFKNRIDAIQKVLTVLAIVADLGFIIDSKELNYDGLLDIIGKSKELTYSSILETTINNKEILDYAIYETLSDLLIGYENKSPGFDFPDFIFPIKKYPKPFALALFNNRFCAVNTENPLVDPITLEIEIDPTLQPIVTTDIY